LRRFGDLRKNTPWNVGACILWILYFVVDFSPSQALCVCVAAACSASATSEKTSPGFLEHVSCGFCICAPPPSSVRLPQLPAALRRPQKKHAPGFLEHVSCGFSQLSSILGAPLDEKSTKIELTHINNNELNDG